MKVTKKTVYEVENFDLQFEPIDDTISIKKTKEGFEVKYLTYDTCPSDPFEFDEGIGNFFHWKGYGAEQLARYCELLGYDPDTRERIKKPDHLAVAIDKYEHSGVAYSISGEGMQCRWDTSGAWAVWYPNDCLMEDIKRFKTKQAQRKRAVELARQACETFNSWANGEVYCIVKETFNKDKNSIDYDIVGGYYGYEYAEKALKTDI